ncbi:hypothetical protein AOLI_G00045930 [Acnodon oligacanthus]
MQRVLEPRGYSASPGFVLTKEDWSGEKDMTGNNVFQLAVSSTGVLLLGAVECKELWDWAKAALLKPSEMNVVRNVLQS